MSLSSWADWIHTVYLRPDGDKLGLVGKPTWPQQTVIDVKAQLDRIRQEHTKMKSSFIPAIRTAQERLHRIIEQTDTVIALANKSLDLKHDKLVQHVIPYTPSLMDELVGRSQEATSPPWEA